MIAQYRVLLDRYHHCIGQPGWHLGPREQIVREMESLLARMTPWQKDAVFEYARELYQRRIG